MLSFLLIYISSIIILLPRENKLNEKVIYAALFSSFPFSQLLLGLISLLSIFFGISKIPILLFSVIIFVFAILWHKNCLTKLVAIKTFLSKEIKNFFNKSNINKFDGIMIGRKIYSNPMFLLDLHQFMNKTTNILSRRQVIEKYIMICNDCDINNHSKYLLLRHLYGLYSGTSSSKMWKKFLNNLIITKNDIENLLTFPENIYVEEIKNYG